MHTVHNIGNPLKGNGAAMVLKKRSKNKKELIMNDE